jgi:hypothetical protein
MTTLRATAEPALSLPKGSSTPPPFAQANGGSGRNDSVGLAGFGTDSSEGEGERADTWLFELDGEDVISDGAFLAH